MLGVCLGGNQIKDITEALKTNNCLTTLNLDGKCLTAPHSPFTFYTLTFFTSFIFTSSLFIFFTLHLLHPSLFHSGTSPHCFLACNVAENEAVHW
jgi:hypothetical protein